MKVQGAAIHIDQLMTGEVGMWLQARQEVLRLLQRHLHVHQDLLLAGDGGTYQHAIGGLDPPPQGALVTLQVAIDRGERAGIGVAVIPAFIISAAWMFPGPTPGQLHIRWLAHIRRPRAVGIVI